MSKLKLLLWSEIVVVLAITGSIGVLSAYSPEAVFGIGLGMFWVGLVGVIFWRRELRRSGKWWARVLVIGLLLRVLVGPVHVIVMNIYYGGHGDIFSYVSSAGVTGRDFLKGKIILPKQKRVTDPRNPDYYQVAQPFRLIEFLNGFFYLLVGPSAFGLFALAAIIGFFGSYLFWRAFRIQYPEESGNRFFACAIFFLPSLFFWTSALGKDSWMLLFLGWITYAFSSLMREMSFRHLLGLISALLLISYLRWPIAGALFMVLAAALILKRWRGTAAILEPAWLILVCVIGGGLLVLSAGIFGGEGYISTGLRYIANPARIYERVLHTAVLVHTGFSATAGGSALPSVLDNPTLPALIMYLPGAMFTFLFRPVVFEAHNALALGAALEGTFFLWLIVVRRRNIVAALRSGFRNPFVMFCLLAFLLLSMLLSFERNLGAIVRHRSMVLPFLLILMSIPPIFRRRERQSASSGPEFERRGSAQIPGSDSLNDNSKTEKSSTK